MKKYIVLIIFIVFNIYYLSGQILDRQTNFTQIATPNVASFNKYIDYPVSIYNGTPDVSIPIHTLKDGAIELPIVLRYNTSGIKVSEEASWVGLGWNLNVGGVITQNVVGSPDQLDKNYSAFVSDWGEELVIPHDGYFDKGYTKLFYYKSLYQKTKGFLNDMQSQSHTRELGKINPDVFYFSYPGNSGKFVFDYKNDSIHVLSRKNDIKIIFDSFAENTNQSNFKIITETGVTHYFYYLSKMYSGGSQNDQYISSVSYVLKKSVYPNGQIIGYNYNLVDYTTNTIQESLQNYDLEEIYSNPSRKPVPSTFHSPHQFGVGTQDGMFSLYSGKEFYLDSITTENYNILFSTSSRKDLKNGLKLDEIKIQSINSPTNSIRYIFGYDYFTSKNSTQFYDPVSERKFYTCWNSNWYGSAGDDQSMYLRLQLASLSIIGIDNDSKENKYDFFYDTETLPRKDSFAVDYWGYYNGEDRNTTYIPNLIDLYYGYSDSSNNLTSQIVKLPINTFLSSYFRAANRGFSFKKCKSSILTGIKFPTGGYMEYVYEPNVFSEIGVDIFPKYKPIGYFTLPPREEVPTYIPCQDEIKKTSNTVTVSDHNISANTKSVKFTIDREQKTTLNIVFKSGGRDWNQILSGKYYINLVQVKGNVLDPVYSVDGYSNRNPFGSGDETQYREVIVSLKPGNYMLSVEFPDFADGFAGGELMASLSYSSKLSILPQSEGAGLRIKNISYYESIDKQKIIEGKNYKYTIPNTKEKSSGMLHDALSFVNIDYLRYYWSEQHTSNYPPSTSYSIHETITRSASVYGNNLISNPYGTSGGVGYTYVQEIPINNTKEKVSYQFINKKGAFLERCPKVDSPGNGEILEKIIYNENDEIVEEEKFTYNIYSKGSTWGMSVSDNNNSSLHPSVAHLNIHYYGLEGPSIATESDRADVFLYKINFYDISLSSKETTVDRITTKEEYSYNPQTLQLKEKKIVNSSDNILQYKYNYPNDYNCDIYKQMSEKHMISNIIEEQISKNQQYIGGKLTRFKQNKYKQFVPDITSFSEIISSQSSITGFTCNGVNRAIFPIDNVIYKDHDSYGNPIHITQNESNNLIYLWSYHGQYPIAEIRGATYDQVELAVKAEFGVTNIDALSKLATPDVAKLQKLRLNNNLSGAHVTTYTYQPLVGMTTMTDPTGVTITYEYDPFGRLKRTKDQNGKTIQEYDYHYRNQ